MKKAVLVFICLLMCSVPLAAFANSAQIQSGLTWLINAKNGNDYWGCKFFIDETVDEVTDDDIAPTYFRDTCEATNALLALNQTGTDYNAAINWISDNKPNTTEKISRKIETLSKTALPYTDDLNLLLSYQNADGGFGGYRKLRSDIADSSYALRALHSINYSNGLTIANILQYIKNNQNAEGGWGFKKGQESKISYTALVLQTLSQFKTTYDLQAPITYAAAYLFTKQNPDGGFGSAASTVYETALAVIALINSGVSDQQSAVSIQDGLNYLTATQQPNGSWNDDPYSTALALRALAYVKPNLSISPNDIVFSNPTPKQGDTITISASVRNTGPSQAENVLVRFYDGDPNATGVLINETTISSIPAYGSVPASITWTIPSAAARSIFVSNDPLNSIDELDETDNIASRNLTSATLPDLSITSADITIAPSAPEPGEVITITAVARNTGESSAGNITADFYDGDPAAGGTFIGRETALSIEPGSVSYVQISSSLLLAGAHTIYVILDKDNSVAESDETNNAATKTFTVGAAIDLSVSAASIIFNPLNPKEGDSVTISAQIKNVAPGTAGNVVVRFYLGDPAAGGTRIGADINLPELPAGGQTDVSISWNSTGHVGNNNIYISVDPDDRIAEITEYNNKAFRTLKVAAAQGPDFTLTASNITFTPQSPLQGDLVTASAIIRNTGTLTGKNIVVQFSIYDAAIGSSLIIDNQTILSLAAGGTVTVQAVWDTSGFSGPYQIITEIDPMNTVAETSETNNTAYVPITVTAPQGPDIVNALINTSGIISNTQTLTISGSAAVTVKNKGTLDTALPFVITAFEDRNNNQAYDPGVDIVLGQTTYSGNLHAGADDTVTMTVSGTIASINNSLYVMADSGNVVAEINETNNVSCLAIFTACRNVNVDRAVKTGASWLIDHQLNVDAQGTMKAWAGSPTLYNDALAVKAYYSTGHITQTKYANVLNKLVNMQAPDGSWDESVQTTADAVLSLINIGAAPKSSSITDAISWLIRVQGQDGSWGGTAGGTGIVLTALLKAGIDKNKSFIQNAAQWLKTNQNSDGYWGVYPGQESSYWIGTYPVIGLALATSPTDARVQSAKNWYNSQIYYYQGRLRAFWLQMMLELEPNNSTIMNMATALLNEQNLDGGWKQYPTFPLSLFRDTADALDILGRLKLSGTKIDNGISWIDNHMSSLWEGFDDQKSVSITAWALNALQSANIGDIANLDSIAKGRKTLVTYQIADGSWELVPVSTEGWVDMTAEALITLKYPRSISSEEQLAATKAINFLIAAQKADGGWPQNVVYSLSHFLSSEGALRSLLQSGLTASHNTVSRGLSYLNAKQTQDGGFDSTGQTARAAMIYKLAGVNYKTKLDQTIAWLKTNQNPDGGWGATLGYTSTTGSTSYALIALSYAGESGIEVARGVSWLLAAQNQDFGWGQVMGVPMSYDSTTAMAVWALSLSRFTLGFDLDMTIDKPYYCPGDPVHITATPDKPTQDITLTGSVTLQEGGSYPLAFFNTGVSFASESTVPSGALPGTATVHVTGAAPYGYGLSTKSFIVRNCSSLRPDLSVSDADISATVQTPQNSDIRLVSATISNLGDMDANAVTVNFYRGAPSPANLIDSRSISNIGVSGSATVSTEITINEDTTVYVVADPDNAIAEHDESNNTGTLLLRRTVADLSVSSSDISIIPPSVTEGQSAVIAAIIHNTGTMGASDMVVSFYDGDPSSGGLLIGSVTKSWIDAGSTAYAEMPWNTFGQSGMNYIHVLIDPLNAVHEANETNNSSFVPVDITPPLKPDLAITGSDITFSSLNPEEGSPLTLTATIRNLGMETANVGVALYDGDPAAGGRLIEMKTVYQLISFGGTASIPFDIPTIGVAGSHKYYISLDPEYMIDEINEANNVAWNLVTIGASGLGLSITTDKVVYPANENISITLSVTNQRDAVRTGSLEVKLLDATGTVVSNATVSQYLTLGTSETQTLNLALNTGSTLAGDYRIFSQFIEAGDAVSKIDTLISIAADRAVSSTVTTDRIAYFPNQQAVISASVTSQSANYIFENLTATVAITSPFSPPCQGGDGGGCQSQVFYTETQPIAILLPGQSAELKTYWNTATNPPGTYPVTLEIRDATGVLVSSGLATLTISSEIKPSRLLRGQISVDQQSILQGDTVNISYQVTNAGNMDLSQLSLSIRTVHVVNLSVYDTLTDHAALLKGESYANAQQLGTATYSAKDYLVILAASINGIEETLASTHFRVEGAPSAPSLNTPAQSSDVETLTPVLTVNNATDPNDDKLTYEFQIYADAGLSTLVAASTLQEEGASITSWPIPAILQENGWYFWRTRAYDSRLYGQWMDPAAFRVNVTNEAPTAPGLSSPSDGSSVDTAMPVLAVNNASDPDSVNLTYNFVVASDPGLTTIVASQVGVFERPGATVWQVPVALQENTWYYWSAQADDWLIIGPWMPVAGFFVNTTNEAPSVLRIIAPVDGTGVASTDALITAANSNDPDSTVLSYIFEVDSAPTFDSADKAVSGSLPQGTGSTSWLASGLRDNTWYYARVLASDGQADSPVSDTVRFFVNAFNDAPTAPVLANPSNGAGVNSFTPELSVHNAADLDGDILTYDFEIYADAALNSLVSGASGIEETGPVTSWIVSGILIENSIYYWRALAFDGQVYGPWMPAAAFMVNTANDAPAAPTLNSPAAGSSLSTLTPLLSISNAADPDSDSLTYEYEIYAGAALVRSMTSIPQNGSGITSATLSSALADNTTYTWRARAYDGDRYGAWMDMATFSIHMPSQNITSTIDFDPNTLNQKSKGNWAAVYIELPVGYNVADIDISSLRLDGIISAEIWPYAIGDYDHDGIPDLMVKFDRNAVITMLPKGDRVKVTVTGAVGATTFEGVDYIRVIQ